MVEGALRLGNALLLSKQCFMLCGMHLIDYLCEETGRAAAMAGRVGLSSQFLYQIARGKRPCPADHVPAVEAASDGQVRRWELRPRDWHRIWPELVGAEGAPAVPAKESDAAALPLAERAAS
jgi:DNA-binding transcriptional regulator YdaS (Cro superfamily)